MAIYYRADTQGLSPGDQLSNIVDPYGNRAFAYATTSLELARAFAVTGFGVDSALRDRGLSVYSVELDQPEADPDFNLDSTVEIVTGESGTIVETMEQSVSMETTDAAQVLGRYLRWPDGSPAYDAEGYATVLPKYQTDFRYDDQNRQNMLDELQLLDVYPDPPTIRKFLDERYN